MRRARCVAIVEAPGGRYRHAVQAPDPDYCVEQLLEWAAYKLDRVDTLGVGGEIKVTIHRHEDMDYDPSVCWMCGEPSTGYDSAGLPVCKNWTSEAPPDE